MKIDRIYTHEGHNPYEGIAFEKRLSVIQDSDGKTIFKMEDIEVPSHWSQTATDVFTQKYFRKAGVPNVTRNVPEEGIPLWLQKRFPRDKNDTTHKDITFYGHETSAKQVFHRLAGCWVYWGWKENYFDSEKDARALYDELIYMLAMQILDRKSVV